VRAYRNTCIMAPRIGSSRFNSLSLQADTQTCHFVLWSTEWYLREKKLPMLTAWALFDKVNGRQRPEHWFFSLVVLSMYFDAGKNLEEYDGPFDGAWITFDSVFDLRMGSGAVFMESIGCGPTLGLATVDMDRSVIFCGILMISNSCYLA